MNHSITVRIFIGIVSCAAASLHADPTITFFFRTYPIITDHQFAQTVTNEFKNPGKIAHYTVHGILKKEWISGIFATYGGYLSSSNINGQIIFPRRHEKPQVHIVITEELTPIMMAGNTIHHWELQPDVPAAMYLIEQKKDEDANLFYWDTTKVELPEDRVVPYDAIAIFAKPTTMYVPTGISVTQQKPNLVLPDIYVKKGIKIYPTTLYVLNLRHFYGPINFMYEKRPESYSALIKP